MRVDTHLGDVETAADDAAVAEAAGYAGAFTGEVNGDPFLSLALAATATQQVELGTSIAIALARSPMSLAYTAYDLQRLSRGRFVLGLGSQVKAHVTRRFSMPWAEPVARMREFVLALRAIWESWTDGTTLDFRGDFYQHTLMPPTFVPAPHTFGLPAVWLAGVGPSMTTLAGEVADGFVCHAFTTERWIRERTVPALSEGRARIGKTLDGFTVKRALFLATGEPDDIERDAAGIRSQLAFYASTPAYRPILDLHGWSDAADELSRMAKNGEWQHMGDVIDDDMLDAFAVVAPIDEVVDRVRAHCAGAVDRVSFITATPQPRLLELFARTTPE
jgi:probable F420-dependent oxidoreductase